MTIRGKDGERARIWTQAGQPQTGRPAPRRIQTSSRTTRPLPLPLSPSSLLTLHQLFLPSLSSPLFPSAPLLAWSGGSPRIHDSVCFRSLIVLFLPVFFSTRFFAQRKKKVEHRPPTRAFLRSKRHIALYLVWLVCRLALTDNIFKTLILIHVRFPAQIGALLRGLPTLQIRRQTVCLTLSRKVRSKRPWLKLRDLGT